MNPLLLTYLGIVTAAVLVGALLSRFLGGKPRTARYTMAFSAGVMLATCLLYLIPDALQFQHGIVRAQPEPGDHVSIGYALSVGFLSLLTIERFLLGAHHHDPSEPASQKARADHDCRRDHEPPHHHQHDSLQRAQRLGLAWSTCVALWLHGLFDGVALYAAGVMPAMGPMLAMAIILHKVPESSTLVTVLQRARVPARQRNGAVLLYLLATPAGMLLAVELLRLLSERRVALLMAFVAGSLLHLVTGHLLPEATQHEDDHEGGRRAGGAFVVMMAGFAVLLVGRVLGAD